MKEPKTIHDASRLYASMLFPSKEGLHWESCHQDFTAGAKWQKEQTKHVLKELEDSLLSAAGTDRPYERALIKKTLNALNK